MPLTDPVPSSAFDVLERNVKDTDKFVNQETGTFTNRFGKVIKPIPVIEAEVIAATASIGWAPAGEFLTGFNYEKLNDVGRDASGSWWRYNGSDLPKVITAGTVPSSPNFSVISFETAENVEWESGKSVGYVLDDCRGVKDELYSQAGVIDDGTQNQLGDSQFIDSLHIVFDNYGTTTEISTGNFQLGKRICVTDRSNKIFLVQSGTVFDNFGTLPAGTDKIAVIDKNQPLNQFAFGATGSGYPINDGPALNAFATFCKLHNLDVTLESINEGPTIHYTLETIDYTGVNVRGSGAGYYDYGVVAADGLGWAVLTGIGGVRPAASVIFNQEARKPKSGICIISDTVLEVVHIDGVRRLYSGFGVSGYTGTANQHLLVDPYNASYRGVIFNFYDIKLTGAGGDAIVLNNGMEISLFDKCLVAQNNGFGLTTAGDPSTGGDANQEYTAIQNSSFTLNRLDGINVDKFRKAIKLDNVGGNSNGWYGLGAYGVGKPADKSLVRALLSINEVMPNATNIVVKNCRGEDCARLVSLKLNLPVSMIDISDNITFPTLGLADTDNDMIGVYQRGTGQIRAMDIDRNFVQSRGVTLSGNIDVASLVSVHLGATQTTSYDISKFKGRTDNGHRFIGEIQCDQHVKTSVLAIGDGTAATFTSDIIKNNSRTTAGGNSYHATATAYLVSANWQANNSSGGGAYIVTCHVGANGSFIGHALLVNATGFSSAPTVSTDGTLNIPLVANYRCTVSRIDMAGWKV